jgi:hypothetical protein
MTVAATAQYEMLNLLFMPWTPPDKIRVNLITVSSEFQIKNSSEFPISTEQRLGGAMDPLPR